MASKKSMSPEEIIKIKEKKIQQLHKKILDNSDKAKLTEQRLRAEKAQHLSSRMLKTRINLHAEEIGNDRVLRYSDRRYDIRNYSKMDKDIWKYEDVRNWFNDHEPTDFKGDNKGVYQLQLDETGYTIRMNRPS